MRRVFIGILSFLACVASSAGGEAVERESTREGEAIVQQVERYRRGQDAEVIHRPDVRVAPFGETIPELSCSMLQLCVIELEAGEEVTFTSAADSHRWQVVVDGMGPGKSSPVILVKPRVCGEDLWTQLVVGTNKRVYKVLANGPKCSGEGRIPGGPASHIRFYYPDEFVRSFALREREQEERGERLERSDLGAVDPASLNFSYRWEKSSLPWRPVQVYDDGQRVFVRLASTAHGLPVLFETRDGQEHLLNFSPQGSVLVVDRLFESAVLALGSGKKGSKKRRVEISRVGR